MASLVAKKVKNLLAMWEIWVWSLGWEDPLQKGMHSFLENSMDRGLQSTGSQRVRQNWATVMSFMTLEYFRAGVPNLWTLMPDDLRWSWCNNNRNKVHNKFNIFELSWDHRPLPWVCGKIVFHKEFSQFSWCQKDLEPLKLFYFFFSLGDNQCPYL